MLRPPFRLHSIIMLTALPAVECLVVPWGIYVFAAGLCLHYAFRRDAHGLARSSQRLFGENRERARQPI
jgi:hypothetical protein